MIQEPTPEQVLDDVVFTEEDIDPADLVVIAPELQRQLKIHKVNAMVRDFQAAGLGTLTVSRRSDGTNVLLDGQHRKATVLALRAEGKTAPQKVRCQVAKDLSPEQEAMLFLILNDAINVAQLDKFTVQITAGDEMASTIQEILDRWGWKLGGRPGDGIIKAVGALQRIYQESERIGAIPNLVDSTLQVITKAWGNSAEAVRGPILEGIALMIGNYDVVDLKHLEGRLRIYEGGPNGLWTMARMNAQIRQLRLPMSVAELAVEQYNKSKRTDVLPTWTRRR